MNAGWLSFVPILALCATPQGAAARDINLTIGKQETLASKCLSENRDILIAESPNFHPGAPVLVLLDAEMTFRTVTAVVDHLVYSGRLPPMLIAGIVNTDRGRDLTPTLDGSEFALGPSDRFLSFIADELLPHIAAEYPIGNYHILAGHSNGGMFSLYAFIRRPEVFQATIALSPSWGLDDRFVALLDRALAQPTATSRFVFVGAGGDEETDIAVGSLRYAKTFEAASNANVEFHYQVFPGETHGSVGMRAFYSALETLGQPDTPVAYGPARYLSEAQRRRHAWVRRFGSAFNDDPLPEFSIARPLLDALASKDTASLDAMWQSLQAEFAADFRFDSVEVQNVLAWLESQGRQDDAVRLRKLAGFALNGLAGNNYSQSVELNAGLIAHLPLSGTAVDLCHPQKVAIVHGAGPVPDGRGYRFGGQGDFIEVPNDGDYSTAGSLSVSVWIRAANPAAYSAWVAQVSRRDRGASQWRLGFGPNPTTQWGATTYGTRWNDYWVAGNGLPVNRWIHMAAVFDQTLGELLLFVDGHEVKIIDNLAPWTGSSGPLLIGAQHDDGIFFKGDVRDVRIYRRTLSSAEIEALSQPER
ncbi:MAG: LamG-like jellyroll fold domain-containing protein [Terracidiphilus sp.]|jgi:hypothetical protein